MNDRISISKIKKPGGTECIRIAVHPGNGGSAGRTALYEGVMTFEDFSKCLMGLSECPIERYKF